MQEWIKIDSDIKAEKSALIHFQPYKTVGEKSTLSYVGCI